MRQGTLSYVRGSPRDMNANRIGNTRLAKTVNPVPLVDSGTLERRAFIEVWKSTL